MMRFVLSLALAVCSLAQAEEFPFVSGEVEFSPVATVGDDPLYWDLGQGQGPRESAVAMAATKTGRSRSGVAAMIAGVIFGAACCVGAWLLFGCDRLLFGCDSEGDDDGERSDDRGRWPA
jgi:hypothetical protein